MADVDVKAGWDAFIAGVQTAVERMDQMTRDMQPGERADGFQVLTRTLGAAHEELEMDRIRPEPVPHNLSSNKFLMDNPDGKYWTFELDPSQHYRLSGNLGAAAYTAIAIYRAKEKWHDTEICANINGADLETDGSGDFELLLGGENPGHGNWLPLDGDARTVWIRQFFNDVYNERPSRFDIVNLDPKAPPAALDPDLLAQRLTRAGRKMKSMTSAIRHAAEHELSRGNHVRVWSEMLGGAVFTSSDIWYQRGAWDLAEDEALVLQGVAPPSQFWNIVLYSRFLNSLDHRNRPVSLTGGKVSTDSDGNYRLIISASDPGLANWLDTEGRGKGMFALRWVCPETQPELPTAKVVKLADLSE
ncbi:MAG: DUF1214 domain-containing protein [Alphaproteobacteria bacterium]|nr:DUF1214 domain-containing protein [Alphaproteobacteria bacterium]